MCNCRATEIILGIIILVFAIWPMQYSAWIVGIAAVLLILHAAFCKNCAMCKPETVKRAAPKRKR
ncbi:MAG: hypothetical protein Q8Q31_00775 [Nanoarchaeota archaeon]|nr:hypothetical protein [Nanoarchaeota archaeon]